LDCCQNLYSSYIIINTVTLDITVPLDIAATARYPTYYTNSGVPMSVAKFGQ